jgi:hypothetical protein
MGFFRAGKKREAEKDGNLKTLSNPGPLNRGYQPRFEPRRFLSPSGVSPMGEVGRFHRGTGPPPWPRQGGGGITCGVKSGVADGVKVGSGVKTALAPQSLLTETEKLLLVKGMPP